MINRTQTMIVQTFRNKPDVQIKVTHMSEADLEALKQEDPFLYRLIPAVHKAKLLFNKANH